MSELCIRVFLLKSVPTCIYCVKKLSNSFHFTRKNESFLHKRSSDVIATIPMQFKIKLTAFVLLVVFLFFPEIMSDLMNSFRPHNLFLLNFR